MKDLKAIHAKHCPKKYFGNFWKSADYAAADKLLVDQGVPESKRRVVTQSAPGVPSQTTVHPLIALAFLRWADPALFYDKLHRTLTNDDFS